MMPAAIPERSWSFPRVGETFSDVSCLSCTGSAPKRKSRARSDDSDLVKLPEIRTPPVSKCDVLNRGFDCTTPSSSIATSSVGEGFPNCAAAIALNDARQLPWSLRSTPHPSLVLYDDAALLT